MYMIKHQALGEHRKVRGPPVCALQNPNRKIAEPMNRFFLRYTLCWIACTSFSNSVWAEKAPDYLYFPPTHGAKNIALMLFGGSEGGLPTYYDTQSLTQQGYACILVGYFGTQNTPESLELIPIEYFEKVIQYFEEQADVKGKDIVAWGGSKGAELALLLGSRYPQIRGVIATVPSSVVFQGIGGHPVSSWSYKGASLPFVPYPDYDWSTIVNSRYVDVYTKALEQKSAVNAAGIEVENINGPILLLSGKEDTMWPSSEMGNMMVNRLREKNFPHPFHHYAYKDAGHSLNPNYLMGGTEEGNRIASEDLAVRITDFLQQIEQYYFEK